jgi:glucan phosphorylase
LPVEDSRTGLTAETLKQAFADNLFYVQGKFPAIATKNDFYMALAYTVRDRLLHHWITTVETYFKDEEPRIVCYLCAESGERYVRMAHLASVGSHAINGVAKLHSELLKRTTLRDFFEFWPEKFLNVHQRGHASSLHRFEQSSPFRPFDR